MALSFTFHGGDLATGAKGNIAPALGKSIGARVDVANAAASSALASSGWYRIVASSTSYVLISSTAADGTGGMHMPAGDKEVLWIAAGDKIGCSAGA